MTLAPGFQALWPTPLGLHRHAEAGAEVSTGLGYRVDEVVAQLIEIGRAHV